MPCFKSREDWCFTQYRYASLILCRYQINDYFCNKILKSIVAIRNCLSYSVLIPNENYNFFSDSILLRNFIQADYLYAILIQL